MVEGLDHGSLKGMDEDKLRASEKSDTKLLNGWSDYLRAWIIEGLVSFFSEGPLKNPMKNPILIEGLKGSSDIIYDL